MRVAATVPSPLPLRSAAALAAAVARAERGTPLHALSITFVGPRRMQSLHARWLGRDGVTDVIAFTYGSPKSDGVHRQRFTVQAAQTTPPGRSTVNRQHVRRAESRVLVGDVYICPAAAARNARAAGVTTREELRRLVVHGTLHVLGWDHPAGAARYASPMWRRQEALLARFARGRAR